MIGNVHVSREAESLGVVVYSLLVGGYVSEKTKWFFAALSEVNGHDCAPAHFSLPIYFACQAC